MKLLNATVWLVDDCAEYIGVHPGTWRGYVARGAAPLPAGRIVDGVIYRPYWHPAAVKAWHKARRGQGRIHPWKQYERERTDRP